MPGVNNIGDIFCRDGGFGGTWKHIPGKLTQVHVAGDGNHVWGCNEAGEIFTYE